MQPPPVARSSSAPEPSAPESSAPPSVPPKPQPLKIEETGQVIDKPEETPETPGQAGGEVQTSRTASSPLRHRVTIVEPTVSPSGSQQPSPGGPESQPSTPGRRSMSQSYHELLSHFKVLVAKHPSFLEDLNNAAGRGEPSGTKASSARTSSDSARCSTSDRRDHPGCGRSASESDGRAPPDWASGSGGHQTRPARQSWQDLRKSAAELFVPQPRESRRRKMGRRLFYVVISACVALLAVHVVRLEQQQKVSSNELAAEVKPLQKLKQAMGSALMVQAVSSEEARLPGGTPVPSARAPNACPRADRTPPRTHARARADHRPPAPALERSGGGRARRASSASTSSSRTEAC